MERLQRIARLEERRAVGLMSGMSADGLDIALVRIRDRADGLDARIEAAATRSYPPRLRQRIHAAAEGGVREACLLSYDLAERWADDVLAFLSESGVAPADVDFLASHGQTLCHLSRPDGRGMATLQVGDGDVLAERTGILTVSDFRPRDIAAGGQGAPLVPRADWLLYTRPGRVIACHNLGSIANVTVVTERPEDVMAFDTGPANALIDAFAREGTADSAAMDTDGALSAAGRLSPELFAALERESLPFLDRPPPRSAGYQDFGAPLARRLAALADRCPVADRVRTAVAFTARTIAAAYERWVLPRHADLEDVVFTGGGVHNPTLMDAIREALFPLGLEVHVPPMPWPDAKEAVAFALLGDETLHARAGNLPSATGARRAVVLGKISC